MVRIDVADIKKTVKGLNGIAPFDEVMTFFYDESGNCRKFSLTENGVNSTDALKGDFVLAGVAYEGLDKEIDVSGLYKALDYKEGQKEIKYRHLYNKSKDFLSFMGSARATAFLEWLEKSGLYIHYSALNNLFYSLVDLVDSLWDDFPQCMVFFWEIKSAHYDFTAIHTDEIIQLLYRFDYPNVTDCQGFCMELCNYIASYSNDDEYYPGFFLELLRQMLETAGKKNKLIFVQDNTPYVLVKEYYLFYLERCQIFSKSIHAFDEEPAVQKQLQDVELVENGKVLQNYSFVSSDKNIYIQISDLVAGLLRGLFMFLDSTSFEDIPKLVAEMNVEQATNFKIIWDMLSKSNSKSMLFIKNANTPKNINDRMEKLHLLTSK